MRKSLKSATAQFLPALQQAVSETLGEQTAGHSLLNGAAQRPMFFAVTAALA